MRWIWCGVVGLWMMGAAAAAERLSPASLVVLVDTSTEMPWAEIRNDRVLQGFTRDLGESLAARLGREAAFLALPRKRIAQALETGEADLACAYMPAWLPGPFAWSQPFLPDRELLLTRSDAARPQRASELAGKAIGTVRGFVYPELERALGRGFLREDAPDASSNLRKLAAGRIDHASVTQMFLDYQLRSGLALRIHPGLELSSYRSQCALSSHSSVALPALNKAIEGMQADGELSRLLQRYR